MKAEPDSPEALNALIRDAQSGDESAFATLLQGQYRRIYQFAYRWCGDTSAAQDITQISCLKLAERISQFRFEAAFSSWLYRLVIHSAHDWYRREKRHWHAGDPTGEPGGSDNTAEGHIYLKQLLQKLDSFGRGYRDTAVLVLGEGLTHAEAAAVLGVAESTISWRLHDIRKRVGALEKEQSA